MRGETEIAQRLISAGTDLSLLENTGMSALSFAAQAGHTEIVKLLIEAGVKLDLQCRRAAPR